MHHNEELGPFYWRFDAAWQMCKMHPLFMVLDKSSGRIDLVTTPGLVVFLLKFKRV